MRCSNCGHVKAVHEHYRPGSDCARDQCACMRFGHPVLGWIFDRWDRLMIRLGR